MYTSSTAIHKLRSDRPMREVLFPICAQTKVWSESSASLNDRHHVELLYNHHSLGHSPLYSQSYHNVLRDSFNNGHGAARYAILDTSDWTTTDNIHSPTCHRTPSFPWSSSSIHFELIIKEGRASNYSKTSSCRRKPRHTTTNEGVGKDGQGRCSAKSGGQAGCHAIRIVCGQNIKRAWNIC